MWMSGTLFDWKDATIHVASHVVHYGTAVFEGARCYATPKGSACFRLAAHMRRLHQSPKGSACFRLDAHMRRLQQSAKVYRMEYPLDVAGWQNAVLETIRANRMTA